MITPCLAVLIYQNQKEQSLNYHLKKSSFIMSLVYSLASFLPETRIKWYVNSVHTDNSVLKTSEFYISTYFVACILVSLLRHPGRLHFPVLTDPLYVYEISDLLDIDWTLDLLYVILVLLPTVLHANRRSSRSPDHPCRWSLWRLIKSCRWCCGLWKAVLHYGTVCSRGRPLFCNLSWYVKCMQWCLKLCEPFRIY